MSIALRKEFRLLLPAWVATLVPATVPIWCMHAAWFLRNAGVVQILSIACFVLGALFLALTPFGQETSFGTFSLMLAQPQPRRRLWWTKMSALTVALGVSLAALCLSWLLRLGAAGAFNDMPPASVPAIVGALACLCALLAAVVVSGGLWTTLLFRQVTTAFWFSLLVPAAIFGAVWFLADINSGQKTLLAEVVAMGVYSIAGFLLAGRLFLQAQDTPRGGETASGPVSRELSFRLLASAFQKKRSSWAALLCKELQMQQVTLVMAGVLALVYLAAVSILLTRHAPAPFLEGCVDSFWVFWLVVPLVIGSVAVAEERNLNTLEGQLCLPARKRTLFAVKLLVVLFLGTALGAGMPWLLDCIAHWAGLTAPMGLPASAPGGLRSMYTQRLVNFFQGRQAASAPGGLMSMYAAFGRGEFQGAAPVGLSDFEVLAALSVLIAAISFYASTISRTAIQALGTALLLLVLADGAYFVTTQIHSRFEFAGFGNFFSGAWLNPNGRPETIWRGLSQSNRQFGMFLAMDLHVHALAWPAAVATFLWLTYGNCRRLQVSPRVWLSNLFGLLTAAALTLLVSNAAHARPWEYFLRMEPAHGPARISAAAGPLKVATWLAHSYRAFFVLLPDGRVWAERVEFPFDQNAAPAPGKFVDSSNWVDMAATPPIGAVGIQSDHTLWAIDSSARAARIGAASDWQAVAGGNGLFLALKQDGTVWQWRLNSGDAPLFPLDCGSDWRGIFADGNNYFLVNKDGSLWLLARDWQQMVGQPPGIPTNFWRTARHYLFAGTNWSSVAEHQQTEEQSFTAAVTADGALWAAGGLPAHLFGRDCPAGLHDEPVRIGGKADWREVSGGFFSIAAIEKNGVLWTKDRWFPEARRPSEHSDWLAVNAVDGCFTALAADGTLSVWPPQYRSMFGLPEPRLRPMLNLNILNTP
jgi:ABC-type transport system involved in multi-copper enzyme maturation permease subunit